MKKTTIILTVLITMAMSIKAQWIIQNSHTTEWINSICFTDINTGYAVGDNGVIRKTTDGGTNWTTQTGTLNDFLSVDFIDMNIGYIVGYSGTILKTTNGGTNWTTQTSGVNNILRSVCFTDANTGYAVGDTGLILKTTNGGTDWIRQTSGTDNHLQCIYFSAPNKGYAVGQNGIVLKTTDGGAYWSAISLMQINNYFMSVFSQESNAGCVVGTHGKIFHASIDMPGTWTEIISGVYDDLNGISFSHSTGYIVGNQGVILKTTDYGNSWTTQSSGTTNDLFSICLTSENTAYASGDNGIILKTTNGGSTDIAENVIEKRIHIYPNPASDFVTLNIDRSNNDNLTLNIYNIMGSLVKTEMIKQNQQQININDLNNGMYVVEIKSDNFTETQKLLIQK